MASYFMMVGVTPQACANSLAWYLRLGMEPEISDVYFMTSQDEGEPSEEGKKYIKEVHELSKEIAPRLAAEAFEKITFDTEDIIWIPEADLPVATRLIAEGILDRCLDDEIVIDITAGRKIMASSAVVAALHLYHSCDIDVKLTYYLLKEFSRQNLKKKAYELGLDEAETIMIDIDDLDAELREIPVK
ncbi:MAG: hypothetical protein ACQET3_10990 [Promethearchaeati archaeon]